VSGRDARRRCEARFEAEQKAFALKLDTGNISAFDDFVVRARQAHGGRAFRLSRQLCAASINLIAVALSIIGGYDGQKSVRCCLWGSISSLTYHRLAANLDPMPDTVNQRATVVATRRLGIFVRKCGEAFSHRRRR
jgi:hypothetical protein